MAQQSSSNMKVIVLAVVSIVLLASTVGALALYLPAQSQIDQKDATIASLESQLSAAQEDIDSSDSKIATYQSQITSLQNSNEDLQDEWDSMNATMYEYKDLYDDASAIIDLSVYATLYDDDDDFDLEANEKEVLYDDTLNYAGYIAVKTNSDADSTYINVTYEFGDYPFSYNQTCTDDDTVIFAVLPGEVTVTIGVLNEAATVDPEVYYYY
jgi:TolA-binding protein